MINRDTKRCGWILFVAGALLCIAGVSVVRAADNTNVWSNIAGGDFSTAGNWTPAAVPGVDDMARFNLNETYTVTFSESVTNDTLCVSNGVVTFDLGGNLYDIDNPTETFPIKLSGDFANLEDRPVLVVSNGTLRMTTAAVQYLKVGDKAGHYTRNGGAILVVTNGGHVSMQDARLAVGQTSRNTSEMLISGPDSSCLCSHVSLGEPGSGSLTIADGAKFSQAANHGFGVGNRSGRGWLTVTGAGSELVAGTFNFGLGATATGRVENAGVLIANTSATLGLYGFNPVNPDAVITLTVTGAGSRFTVTPAAGLRIGVNDMDATLVVEDGGLVECTHASGIFDIRAPRGAVRGDGGRIEVLHRVLNDALMAPGTVTDPGTLTLQGDYEQSATGRLQINISADGTSSSLDVDGDATLAGDLVIAFVDGALVEGTFDVLTATGAMTGAVNLVVDPEFLPGGCQTAIP